MRGQNVLAFICQSRERKQVKFSIWHHNQCLLLFEFGNASQESVEKLLRESHVRFLFQNLRTVLCRRLLQFIPWRQCVSVNSITCQCESVGVRTVEDILDKKFGWTEFTLELAKVNRFRRSVSCGRICIKL